MHICGLPSALRIRTEGHNCDALQRWELDPPTVSTAYSTKQHKGQGLSKQSASPQACQCHVPHCSPTPLQHKQCRAGSARFSSRGHNQLVTFCQVKPQQGTCERKFHTRHEHNHRNRSSASSGHSKPNRTGFYGSHQRLQQTAASPLTLTINFLKRAQ